MPTHDELVDIPVGDHHIAGTLVAPRTLIPGVLFVHGWGGSQRQYCDRARRLAEIGCACLTFDLRGHAKTRSQYETVTREDNLGDVVAAYDTLAAQRNVDTTRMAVVGSSYGGYLAAILTSLRRVKWLALRAPALYKDSDWSLAKRQLKTRQALDAYRLQRVRPDESRALRACSDFTGDVLLVESQHDRIIPHQVVVNYRDACVRARAITHRVLQGADHALSEPSCQQSYTSTLVDWLAERMFGAELGAEVVRAQSRAAPTPERDEPEEEALTGAVVAGVAPA
jgi:pimeloyl-ACP methyl ester carboxylesterase